MSAVVDFAGKEVEVTEEKLQRIVDEILMWLEGHPDASVKEFEALINEIIRREDVPWPALLTTQVAAALTFEGARTIFAHTDIGGFIRVGVVVRKPFSKEYVEKVRKIVEIVKERYVK